MSRNFFLFKGFSSVEGFFWISAILRSKRSQLFFTVFKIHLICRVFFLPWRARSYLTTRTFLVCDSTFSYIKHTCDAHVGLHFEQLIVVDASWNFLEYSEEHHRFLCHWLVLHQTWSVWKVFYDVLKVWRPTACHEQEEFFDHFMSVVWKLIKFKNIFPYPSAILS